MSHNYDNDTWEDNPRRKVCRAPACRCDSPCDDYNDSGKRCARCYKSPDDCGCERCAAGTCFADDCDHCADCGEFADDCVCADEDLRDDDVPALAVPRTWLPPQMREMNEAMPGCVGCVELRAELAVLRAQRPVDKEV